MISGGRRLNAEEEEAIRRELAELRQEHRDLDAAISFMVEIGRRRHHPRTADEEAEARPQGQDRSLEDRLLPDIIA